MADNKINMPSGMGGLVRYFDEYKSKLQFKPGHIVVIAAIIIMVIILLHWQGYSLLGLE